MKRLKIHYGTNSNGSTLCARAIKVRGYVELFITNNESLVDCLECKRKIDYLKKKGKKV